MARGVHLTPTASLPSRSRHRKHEYGFDLVQWDDMRNLDGVIVAVAHKHYNDLGQEKILSLVRHGGVVVDVKSMFRPAAIERALRYWSL